MRVISGSAKGHKLTAPNGLDTRPTTDRIKETLFNIISPEIYGCNFLDLFSGSGGIGIEALSRGAKTAVFVDKSTKAVDAIKANLNHTKLNEGAFVYCADVFEALKTLSLKGIVFDIIFMDPPYSSEIYEKVLKSVVELSILNSEGFVVAEHSSKFEMPKVKGLKIYRTKDFKTTAMSFLSLED